MRIDPEFVFVCMYVCTLISPIKAKEANKDHVLQKNDKIKNRSDFKPGGVRAATNLALYAV